MAIRSLIPWRSREQSLERSEDPFFSLQREVNRLFDRFWDEWDDFGLSRSWVDGTTGLFRPKVDVVEDDDEFVVTAEVPGIDEKDIDISIQDGVLLIRGKKEEEKEQEGKERYRYERVYGSFHRSIPLPGEIDDSKVTAQLKNGVLKITLPKTEEAQKSVKKIPVRVS